MAKLNDKQDLFCREYIKDWNGAAAAIRAGYSKRTAASQASRLLTKVNISARIGKAMQNRVERVEVDADWVLKKSVELTERCFADIRPVIIGGEQAHSEDGDPMYTFNAQGAAKGLELVGKHVDIQAFKDQLQVEGSMTIEEFVLNKRKQRVDELTA